MTENLGSSTRRRIQDIPISEAKARSLANLKKSPHRGNKQKGEYGWRAKLLKDAILEAASLVGQDGKGTGELVGYCVMLATDYPTVFASLLGRVLPMQVTGKGGGPIQVLHLDPRTLEGLEPEELTVLERLFARYLDTGKDKPTVLEADPSDYARLIGSG